MPVSNPLLPSVPDGLHVDDLQLDAAGLVISADHRGRGCLSFVRASLTSRAQCLLADVPGSALAGSGRGLADQGPALPL